MARGGNVEEKGMCGDSGAGEAVTASPFGERAARCAAEVSNVSGHKVPRPKGPDGAGDTAENSGPWRDGAVF